MTFISMNTSVKDYISSIVSEDSWNYGNFRINPYTGLLQYKIEEDLVDTIDNSKDDRRAIQCSDLLNELKRRNYNLIDSKGIDPLSGELSFISEYDEDGCATKFEVISNSITESQKSDLTFLQSDLLNIQIGDMPNNYISNGSGDYSAPEKYGLKENYYNFRLVKDLINKSTVINLMPANDKIYTDTLDLSSITYDNDDTKKGISIRLGVNYTLVGSDIVQTREFIFPYDEDVQYDINGNVNVEYFDKCIRLFPSEDVNECIIEYCHLLYQDKEEEDV